jgi:hypothetical protein
MLVDRAYLRGTLDCILIFHASSRNDRPQFSLLSLQRVGHIQVERKRNVNGKGSKSRPFSIDHVKFNDRWAAAFGKKKKKTQPPTKTLPEPTAIDETQSESPASLMM